MALTKGAPRGRPPTLLELNGQTLPLRDWASRLGVRPGTLRKRIRGGRTPEEVASRRLKPGRRPRPGSERQEGRTLESQGVTLSVSQWAARLGISRHTIYKRLSRGCSVEQALKPLGTASEARDPPLSRAPAYIAWSHARRLAQRSGAPVHPPWNSFHQFLGDLGPRPAHPDAELRTVDPLKGFTPSNCFWSTKKDRPKKVSTC